jgi:succinoglycan biosynthesis protein ExoA
VAHTTPFRERRLTEGRRMSDTPFISVLVPVRNESAFIRQTLAALQEQDYPRDRCEFLVVDGDSDDDTADQVRRLQDADGRVRLFFNPKRFSSAARNIGVRHGRGDLFVLVDGHCTVPHRGYLRAVAEAFEESGADCLGRPQPLNPDGLTIFQQAVAAARHSPLGHNPDSHIYATEPAYVRPQNVAVAYRRRVFEQVGLFDERFDACEDVEFNYRVDRAGLACYFAPSLRLPYHPRSSLRRLFQQMARYGRGRWRLARKHPASLTLPAVVPALFLLGVLLTAAAAVVWPAAAAACGVLVGCYVLVVAAGTAVLLRLRYPAAVLLRVPAVFAAIHGGFGWGMLAEVSRSLTRRRGT